MSRITLVLIAITVLTALVPAQAPAAPPKEMARFEKLLGTWIGSGTTRMSPEEPEAPWTSRSTTKKVMGGHFIRDDTLIDIKGQVPMNLAFITFYAWDATQSRYMVYSVTNMGELQVTELEWTDDNTIVQQSLTHREGKNVFERWVTKIKGDEVTFEGSTAGATGGLWTMVKGKMTRSKDAEPVSLDKAGAMAMMKPGEEMKRLARMAGNYTLKGSWSMSPDQKAQTFDGTELVRPIFGGLVVESRSAGEGYEEYSASVWNPRQKRYVSIGLNSWGLHHRITGFWASDQDLVFTFEGEMMGQKLVTRSVLRVDKNGQAIASYGHMISGASDPFKSFEATYSAKGGSKSGGN